MMETQICSIRFWSQSILLTKADCIIRWTVSPWSHQIHHMVNWSSLTTNSEDSSRETKLLVQICSWHFCGLTPFPNTSQQHPINQVLSGNRRDQHIPIFLGKEEAHWLAEAIYQKCTHTALSYMPGPIAFHRSILFLDTLPTCHNHVSQKAYEEILHLMRTLRTFSYTRATVQWICTGPSTLVGLSKIAQQVWPL